MGRTLIHLAAGTTFVAIAACLLADGMRWHARYGKAHTAADRAFRQTAPPTSLPASPESFLQKAERDMFAVAGLAVAALLMGLKTRRSLWFMCFTACLAIAVVSFSQTGIRY